MICPKCQAAILDDSRFCSKCGTPVSSSDDMPTCSMVQGAEELAPGTVVGGKYRILEGAGRGGMGVVYKAEDSKLRRVVALKFLPPELAGRPELRERFLIEARAAAALSHPNICTIHEIYDQEERPFLEMEYVEGRSLRALIQERALEADEAAGIALQVAEALQEAHRKGVVHRDIKSANIMVTGKSQAKVMDFGLAKMQGETGLTREGATLGTAAYMSPEQARGEAVDARTDVWSLGVVLYEMLSGVLPFAGERQVSVLYSVVHEEPKPLSETAPGELRQIIKRALQKDVRARYASAAEMAADLRKYLDRRQAAEWKAWRVVRKPRVAIPALALLILLCAAGGWWFHRQSKVHWAREQALPEIERLLLEDAGGTPDATAAYRVAEEAEKYIGGDPRLAALLERCSIRIDLKTQPAGAAIWFRHVSAAEAEWRYLGKSPLEKIRLPVGNFFWRVEKQGYQTVMAVAPTFRYVSSTRTRLAPRNFERVLDPVGKLPPGMARVAGGAARLPDFFIDQYEVSNRQYKEFIDGGGYRDSRYWRQEFIKDGKKLAWKEAMAQFVDQSGRPGPSTWTAGDYPAGQDTYPVSGVSWYEAAAYAEFRGKSLPSVYHWGQAAGVGVLPPGWMARASNFGTGGPAAAGSRPGMAAFGAYDMAGNVREWCWNAARNGRTIRGGAWNDAAYMFAYISQAAPFDRSPRNGFRCALYPDRGKVPDKMFAPWLGEEAPDFYRMRPVTDSVFQVYRDQFSYDKKPLNARTEWRKESAAGWIEEKVIMDAAYLGDELPVYLFLPRNSRPPYQTVVYFPGAQPTFVSSSKDLDQYHEFVSFLSFIVKNGRAVAFPVYRGTFERREAIPDYGRPGTDSRQFTELTVRMVQDFRTCVDYLESRSEFDGKRLAYLGYSWGGILGSLIPAVEDRVRASVLVVGGMPAGPGRSEIHPINYLPRVKVPTLMLNGRYDASQPFETTVKPMFDLLGTPSAHKKLVVYDTDHFIPRNELIKETLAWLDRYLGPVR